MPAKYTQISWIHVPGPVMLTEPNKRQLWPATQGPKTVAQHRPACQHGTAPRPWSPCCCYTWGRLRLFTLMFPYIHPLREYIYPDHRDSLIYIIFFYTHSSSIFFLISTTTVRPICQIFFYSPSPFSLLPPIGLVWMQPSARNSKF